MAKRENAPAEGELSDSFRARLVDYLMDERRLPSIGRELAYGVADIRQKLVEEGMYGRSVTPPIEVGIHGREPSEKGDPLGRSRGDDPFLERCREAYAAHDQQSPEPAAQEPER